MSAPVVGFAGLTHLGLVSAIAVASQGLSSDRLSMPTLRACTISQPASCRSSNPDLDELARAVARSHILHQPSAAILPPATSSTSRRDVPTDDAGESDLSAISA